MAICFGRLAARASRVALTRRPQNARFIAAGAAAAASFAAITIPSHTALLDAAPEKPANEHNPDYPFMPPKLNDPEYNAEVMASWREKIAEARDLFAKLDVAGAERALQLALEQAAHFGNTSGPVATSLLNLAQLYKRSGRLDEALPLLERAVDVLDETAGPHNKVTLLACIDLASLKLERGDTSGALAQYDQVLSRLEVAEQNQKHAKQPLQSVRAGCLFAMAKGLSSQGLHELAEGKLREVLSILEARWGERSSKLLAPCAELAKCLAQQGRKEEGEAFVVRAEGLADLKPKQLEGLQKMWAEQR